MKKILLLMLTSAVLVSCTLRTELPYADAGVYTLPQPEKLPYKSTYVRKNSDRLYEKLFDNGSGIKSVFALPVDRHLDKAAADILPLFFAETSFSDTPSADKGLILSMEVSDFNPDIGIRGISTCISRPAGDLKLHVMDRNGREIYSTTVHHEGQQIEYSCASTKAFGQVWNRQVYSVLAEAMVSALRNLRSSYAVNSYLEGTPASLEPVLKQEAQLPQTATDNDRLKNAFENGYITSAQLSKALGEINGNQKSKILEAFLSGKLEAKNFGELY